MGTFINRSDILKVVLVLLVHQTLGKRTLLFTENVIPEEEISGNSTRDGKLLPFLALVNVAQSQCTVTGMTGTCVKKSVCTSMKGVELGTCGGGFGTCCQIKRECTADPVVVTTNLVRLVPGAEFHELCRYVLQKPATSKKKEEICQIRLDFTRFMIAEGTDIQFTGDCDADTLTISGQTNAKLGPLCGNLDKQRMYLNYGDSDKINLDIFMMADGGQTWDILVTQIKCNSPDLAPPGCLQYFTEQRMMVKSFNFDLGHQLNNQDYSICVRTNPSMKTITWRTCGGDQDFSISGDPTSAAVGVGATSGDMCNLDFVMIYGDKRYCGTWFEGSVSTTTQPFMMHVHFDDEETAIPPGGVPQMCNVLPLPKGCDLENKGFCLVYSQSPN